MKNIFTLVVALLMVQSIQAQLMITGAFDGTLSGGNPRGVELYVTDNIADLSDYSIDLYFNANTSSSSTYTFPAEAASAGDYIYVVKDATEFNTYFGLTATYTSGSFNSNGDDNYKLLKNGEVIDVLGTSGTDGTGEDWEFLDGWIYRVDDSSPSTTFMGTDWTNGVNVFDGVTVNSGSASPMPIGTFTTTYSAGEDPVDYDTITVDIVSDLDNTIYESATGALSSGVGPKMIAGKTNGGLIRRALVSFDISNIPAGAIIHSAEVAMKMVKTSSAGQDVALHRVTADWGEGTSNDGTSGNGATATSGDATWIHAFYSTVSWTSAGGDYDAAASATIEVDGLGDYSWTSADLAMDVQEWLDGDESNYGWMVIGNEGANKTTKHFATHEATAAADRPNLSITYLVVAEEEEPVIPFYAIGTINTTDADGVADSVDVDCYTEGIVYGIDMNGGTPSQFTIIDANGDGMGVFFGAGNYTVMEGDEVKVYGTVTQFNGLTQMGPDSVVVISSGNALMAPTVVTSLGEDTESQLVRMNGMTLVDASEWPASGSANVDITDGVDTFAMRIDSDTDIDGQDAPVGMFDVIGIGGQYDSSNPYTDGYQLFPRYYTDIIATTTQEPDTIPFYAVGTINTIDADGVGDSIDVECYTVGYVYGVNLNSGSSSLFTIIDGASDGIAVYFPGSDYSVMEGDDVKVYGTVSQYNGLMQIIADSVIVMSQGNTLMAETVVTSLGEATESQLVRMNGMTMVDASQWPAEGSNANIDITDGVDTFTMRIDKETNSDGMAAPTGTFDVIGIGGQFDSSSPYSDGYQLLPRYYADIIPQNVTAPAISIVDMSASVMENAGTVDIRLAIMDGNDMATSVDVVLSASSTATETEDFTFAPATVTFAAGMAMDTQMVTVTIVDDAVFEDNEMVKFTLANATNDATYAMDTITITIMNDDDQIGIENPFAQDLAIYPNPVNTVINVITDEQIETYTIYNEVGQLIRTEAFVGTSINLSDLPRGIYQLRLSSDLGQRTVKLIKQ